MTNKYSLYSEAREILKRLSRDFKLSDFYVEDHASDDLLGIKNFSDERDAIESAIESVKVTLNAPQKFFTSLPLPTLEDIRNSSQELYNILQEMRTFHQRSPNNYKNKEALAKEVARVSLTDEKRKLVDKFNQHHAAFQNAIAPLMNWGIYNQVNSRFDQVQTSQALAPHSWMFNWYSWSHFLASLAWLVCGVCLFAFTVYYSHFVVYAEIQKLLKSALPWQKILSLTILNLFSLGMLASITFWAFRNYTINKHNQLLNRIKWASLKSYGNFIAAATEREQHNIVLKKVLDTVFETDSFGYLLQTSETNIPLSQFAETIIQSTKKD